MHGSIHILLPSQMTTGEKCVSGLRLLETPDCVGVRFRKAKQRDRYEAQPPNLCCWRYLWAEHILSNCSPLIGSCLDLTSPTRGGVSAACNLQLVCRHTLPLLAGRTCNNINKNEKF